jgi:hypothetical protein
LGFALAAVGDPGTDADQTDEDDENEADPAPADARLASFWFFVAGFLHAHLLQSVRRSGGEAYSSMAHAGRQPACYLMVSPLL